jgi:hypothetical protein
MHPGWRYRLKRVANALSLIVAAPAAAACWLETRTTDRGEAMFGFWAQLFALLPGRPGMYLRRGFYRLTLTRAIRVVTSASAPSARIARCESSAVSTWAFSLIGSRGVRAVPDRQPCEPAERRRAHGSGPITGGRRATWDG